MPSLRSISRSVLLLPLLLLSGAALGPQDAVLVVFPGPLTPQRVVELTHQTAFYGDHGSFALAEVSPRQLDKLSRMDVETVVLGAWPEGRDLWTVRRGEPLGGAEILYSDATQALASVPAGNAPGDALHAGCHAAALVRRSPQTAGPGFAGVPGVFGGVQQAVVADSRITPLVAQVNPTNLQATVAQLSSWFTRRATSNEVLLAKDWLVAQAGAIPGVIVSTETFDAQYGPNVIAEISGSVHPERIIVLGAHYDSINQGGSTLSAPGADDNASGSAGVLESLRILAQGDFENTIRCVWFCAEEFGLIGSSADAAALDAASADVVAMLNMDMIAYRAPGDAHDLDLVSNSTDPVLTQFCADVTAAYVPTLPVVFGSLSGGSSDHAAYNSYGFPAAFYFEDLSDFTPAIHTSGDTLGPSANDFTLAGDITRSFVAAAATLARPVDMALGHTALADTIDSGGPYPLSVDVSSLTAASVDSVQAFYRVDGGSEQSVALMPSNTVGTWVGSLPGVAPSGDVTYHLLATDSNGDTQWLPEAFEAGGKTYGFTVGTIHAAFADAFEGPGDNGWTHVQLLQQDDWQRGDPAGKSGDPADAAEGSSVWGNDLGPDGYNGAYQPDVDNYLDSPSINTIGKTGLHLRFKRWLTVEDGFFDQATISVDGTQVWANPATPGGGTNHTIDTDWVQEDIDVSALADNDPSVTVRFRLRSDGGVEFGGWTIDDLQLASVAPGAVPPLVASAVHVSAGDGAVVNLDIDAGPAFAGRKYILALSATGTAPGTPLGSVTIPLIFDLATQLGLNSLGSPVFQGFGGLLSAQGTATATFVSPPVAIPSLPGLELHLAAFTFSPIDWASNAVTIEYQP